MRVEEQLLTLSFVSGEHAHSGFANEWMLGAERQLGASLAQASFMLGATLSAAAQIGWEPRYIYQHSDWLPTYSYQRMYTFAGWRKRGARGAQAP